MKRCPQCNRAYADDTLRFCLDDGVTLSAAEQPDLVQRSPTSRRDDPQTVVLHASPFNPQPAARPRSIPAYVYILASLLVVSIVLLFAGVGLVAWLKLRGTDTPPVANKRSAESERRGTPTPSPSPSPDSLTRLLLGTWSWGNFEETFLPDGTGTLKHENETCFKYRYDVSGGVLRLTVVGERKCGPTGLDYRISIEGDQMRQEYTGNGYVSNWKRVR